MPDRWTPPLAIGVEAIDERLRELFRSAERVVDAVRGGARAEALPLVRRLDDCAARHFAAEERLMEEAGYPGRERHAAAHRAFRAECADVVRELERSGPTALAALEIHNWLSDRLRKHVGAEDRELAAFLAARGG